MQTSYFGDLEGKMRTGVKMAEAHNAKADQIYAETGYVVQRYDMYQVQRAILNAHKRHYGMLSKYDGKGNLVASYQ
jgi:hypothetical protein